MIPLYIWGLKNYEWMLRDTYRWVEVSKPLTDGG